MSLNAQLWNGSPGLIRVLYLSAQYRIPCEVSGTHDCRKVLSHPRHILRKRSDPPSPAPRSMPSLQGPILPPPRPSGTSLSFVLQMTFAVRGDS